MSKTSLNNHFDTTLYFFASPGIRVASSLLIALIVCRLLLGSLGYLDVLIPLFLFSFRGLVEWLAHYYIFHEGQLPILGVSIRSPISKMHREHHRNPSDIKTAIFGWKAYLLGFSALLLLLNILGLQLRLSITMVASSLIIVMVYDYFHLLAHSGVNVEASLFKKAVDRHREHHIRVTRSNMGVSALLGDRVFGGQGCWRATE